ncbi:MAG TPA: Hpt domain-containing protein [Thermohalobaculum sp.]|nr:Hpt domain-containing protein [Thermohalobaculum sp.]
MFQRRPADATRPVLDTGHLARLESHLGAPVLAELLADGLIELTDRLRRLAELERAGDLDGLARLGHDLVGMAGNLGLARLSATAGAMHRAACAGRGPEALAEAGGARRLGFEAADALRRHLAALRRA